MNPVFLVVAYFKAHILAIFGGTENNREKFGMAHPRVRFGPRISRLSDIIRLSPIGVHKTHYLISTVILRTSNLKGC
jgi:hypothetical protein